jgi:hypothetical protein
MEVRDSQNQVFGYIKKHKTLCTPSYSLVTPDEEEILKIRGPEGSGCCCSWADCGSEDFDIRLPDGTTSIGKISTEWEYVLEDLCGVFVPVKLDDRTMSLLLGSVFLLVILTNMSSRNDSLRLGKFHQHSISSPISELQLLPRKKRRVMYWKMLSNSHLLHFVCSPPFSNFQEMNHITFWEKLQKHCQEF